MGLRTCTCQHEAKLDYLSGGREIELRFTNASPSGQVSIRVPKPVYALDDLMVEEEAQGRVRNSPGGSAHTSSRIPSKTAAASKADHLAAGRVKVTKGLAGTTSTYLNLAGRRVTTKSSN